MRPRHGGAFPSDSVTARFVGGLHDASELVWLFLFHLPSLLHRVVLGGQESIATPQE
jgi:hypothetical protein